MQFLHLLPVAQLLQHNPTHSCSICCSGRAVRAIGLPNGAGVKNVSASGSGSGRKRISGGGRRSCCSTLVKPRRQPALAIARGEAVEERNQPRHAKRAVEASEMDRPSAGPSHAIASTPQVMWLWVQCGIPVANPLDAVAVANSVTAERVFAEFWPRGSGDGKFGRSRPERC